MTKKEKRITAAKRSKKWREDFPTRHKKNQRNWYLKNRKRILAEGKKNRHKNAKKFKEAKIRRRAANPAQYMLSVKKNECKKFGSEFSLDLSDLLPLPKLCPVLGLEINYLVLSGRPEDCSPSIDRLNNNLGYVHGNVRVICNRANRLKSDGTREEHLNIAKYMEDTNVGGAKTT
jgi:hypothetical protein